jgi:superfamily II DNA or RNA helicase
MADEDADLALAIALSMAAEEGAGLYGEDADLLLARRLAAEDGWGEDAAVHTEESDLALARRLAAEEDSLAARPRLARRRPGPRPALTEDDSEVIAGLNVDDLPATTTLRSGRVVEPTPAAAPRPRSDGYGGGGSLLWGSAGGSGGAVMVMSEAARRKKMEELVERTEDLAKIVAEDCSVPAPTAPALETPLALMPHQVEGVRWLQALRSRGLTGAILADEMGLGKTAQALSYLGSLVDVGRPHLLVVPLSVLPQWLVELERWAPTLTVEVLQGEPEARRLCAQRIRSSPARCDLVLTTFEIVLREQGPLSRVDWSHIVIDEAHRLKNPASRLAVALRALECEARLLLTGTPLQNNLEELFSLCSFVCPTLFDGCSSFTEWFGKDRERDRALKIDLTDDEQAQATRRLHKVLAPFMLRRVKAVVLRDLLPPKEELVVWCPQSPAQARMGALIEGRVASRDVSLSNVSMQLRHNANHPLLLRGVEPLLEQQQQQQGEWPPAGVLAALSGKLAVLDAVMQHLARFGHRAVIFSQFVRTLDLLDEFLASRGHEVERFDGAMASEDRQAAVARFMSPGAKSSFLVSTRAGGLGLNLTAADTVILFDSDWNPQADCQARDRCHRIGARTVVKTLRLATVGSIETVILERAGAKLGSEEAILGLGQFDDKTREGLEARERGDAVARFLESRRRSDESGRQGSLAAVEATPLEEVWAFLRRPTDTEDATVFSPSPAFSAQDASTAAEIAALSEASGQRAAQERSRSLLVEQGSARKRTAVDRGDDLATEERVLEALSGDDEESQGRAERPSKKRKRTRGKTTAVNDQEARELDILEGLDDDEDMFMLLDLQQVLM